MGALPNLPPFTAESALRKVQSAEDLWNTGDPDMVVLAYTEDAEWRNRDEFLAGRDAIHGFLTRKWQRELGYKLRKELWTWSENRIAVRFEYESYDEAGQWYRSYGVELWEFAADGRRQRRYASINDAPIAESERRIR